LAGFIRHEKIVFILNKLGVYTIIIKFFSGFTIPFI
jgi:hypothetical protein